MTKVEKDAIRARCEAATPGPWELLRVKTHGENGDWFLLDEKTRLGIIEKSDVNAAFIAHARQDIPALLEALEGAEAQISGHYKAAHELGRLHADMIADRDRWKARAKALERALREDGSCVSCAYVAKGTLEEPCCACDRGQGNFYNWQFDEARFSKQEDAK